MNNEVPHKTVLFIITLLSSPQIQIFSSEYCY